MLVLVLVLVLGLVDGTIARPGRGMHKKYVVRLTEEERSTLMGLVGAGKAAARKLTRARVLLKVDEGGFGPGWTDEAVAEALDVGTTRVRNVRQRFVEVGFGAAINRKKQRQPSRLRKLDGAAEARLLAIACSDPPTGRARWTLHLLAEERVALEVVETVSHDTVWSTLKKTSFALT